MAAGPTTSTPWSNFGPRSRRWRCSPSRIESAHGRERSYRNAPRTLDLDLLLYADLRLATPELTLPHPRLQQRAFVLAPLAEIAPGLVVPELGSVTDLLARVAGQRVDKL